jgi:RNA polymerase sigma-B factor
MAARLSGIVPAGDLVPAPRAEPGRAAGQELAGLGDQALVGLVQSLPRDSRRRAVAGELLVTRYQGLVRSCVRPYRRSPVPEQDLMQVGYVGLLKAIGNFDPAAGATLSAYARPCISGELKRYFRDKRWPLHVIRPVQEMVIRVRDAAGPLTQQLGRTPTDSDLAQHLGVSGEEVRQAQQAQLAFNLTSLDAPLAGQPTTITVADTLGAEDPRLEHMLAMRAVAAHWGELPPRERQILIMDFRGGLTQTQIGQRLHISQMHVSRLRARALAHLRARLLDLEPPAVRGSDRPQHPSRDTAMTGTGRLPAGPRLARCRGRHQRQAVPANSPACPRTTADGAGSFLNQVCAVFLASDDSPYTCWFPGRKVTLLLWTPAARQGRSLFFPRLHGWLPGGSRPWNCHCR